MQRGLVNGSRGVVIALRPSPTTTAGWTRFGVSQHLALRLAGRYAVLPLVRFLCVRHEVSEPVSRSPGPPLRSDVSSPLATTAPNSIEDCFSSNYFDEMVVPCEWTFEDIDENVIASVIQVKLISVFI